MRNRSRDIRRRGALSLSGAALALIAAGPTPTVKLPSVKPSRAKVQITVTDIRSSEGVVRACMTSDPARFPRCRGGADAHALVVPAKASVTLTFDDVKPGTYAIALLHDENSNGKADRALGMMPTEGFGFSRDAKVRMGPPEFADAAFAVGSANISQTMRMRYML